MTVLLNNSRSAVIDKPILMSYIRTLVLHWNIFIMVYKRIYLFYGFKLSNSLA